LLHFHHAVSPSDLAVDLARFVAERLRVAMARRGQALLVVSGGSTPVPFFEALSQEDLDWPRVAVTLADERWLPAGHADSNERLVRQHLLQGHAAAARFVPLYNGGATPEQGQPHTEAALAALPWPADAVILGMGGDGHTASLFPQAPCLLAWPVQTDANATVDTTAPLSMAVPMPSAPNVPVPRLSMTPQALLQTSQLIVHITGQAKLGLLRQAMQPGPVADLPIRLAVLQTHVPCAVFHSP
jgi:6-phosphogluconolactonase